MHDQRHLDTRTPVQRALARKHALYNERSTWVPHWQELGEVMAPRQGRFFKTDRNKGDKRHQAVLDHQAILGSRVLSAGMMSGMTSPARPWFRFGLGRQLADLAKRAPVSRWLHEATETTRAVFQASNTYRVLQDAYRSLGVFGSFGGVREDDFENVIHLHPFAVGEFMLGVNDKGVVDTVCREFQMTAGQMLRKFGFDACSDAVQQAINRRSYDQWFDVIHLIEPNELVDPRKADYRGKPWKSCYFEPLKNPEKFLRQSGYRRNPILAARWDVTGLDAYGESPGMECLGAARALQHRERRKAQAIDYMSNPPLAVPTTYNEKTSSRLPGGLMYYGAEGAQRITSAFDVRLDLNALQADVEGLREQVQQSFYVNMFLMLAQGGNGQMTATEVVERHEEKLLMLGPVLERLHNELLAPLVEATFDRCLEAGVFPPPPPDLEGVNIEVEFISTLAQAQRAVGAASIDRVIGNVSTLAASSADPSVWDNINLDKTVEIYGAMFGVDPEILRSEDEKAALREARAQAQAQAQAMAAAQQGAATAKDLAAAPTQAGNSNALQDVLGMFTGYNQPSPLDSALQIGA